MRIHSWEINFSFILFFGWNKRMENYSFPNLISHSMGGWIKTELILSFHLLPSFAVRIINVCWWIYGKDGENIFIKFLKLFNSSEMKFWDCSERRGKTFAASQKVLFIRNDLIIRKNYTTSCLSFMDGARAFLNFYGHLLFGSWNSPLTH